MGSSSNQQQGQPLVNGGAGGMMTGRPLVNGGAGGMMTSRTGPMPALTIHPGINDGAVTQPMTQPYAPNMPQAQPGNVWDQSAGAYSGAIAGTQGAMAGPNLAQFQNPYQQQVFDQGMQGLDRARMMAMNDVGAQATRAGAFGGSRHGVAEAETNRGFADAAGNLSANLASQGFNTALQAGQNQQQLQMQGAGQLGNLSNLGFGFGQQITAGQNQQGAQQQGIQQQLIDAMRAQFGGYTGAPGQGVDMFSRILSGTPYSQTQTTKESPGLMGILGAGLSLL